MTKCQNILLQKFFSIRKNEKIKYNGWVTFKENCADIRNSKVLEIIKLLISKGHNINLYDPYLKNIVINNKRFGVKSIKNFKKQI